MEPWTWGVVALLVVGVAVILAGALVDRRRTARARAEILAPPERPIPRFAGTLTTPAYVTEVQARRQPAGAAPTALEEPDRRALQQLIEQRKPTRIAVGWISKAFVTDEPTGWAVLDEPRVLACAEPVTSIRELLEQLDVTVRSDGALVIAAPSISPDVLATLEVNQIQRKLRTVAIVAGPTAGPLERIAAATGAVPVARADLQSGYVPATTLGRCTRWVSGVKETFVITDAAAGTDGT